MFGQDHLLDVVSKFYGLGKCSHIETLGLWEKHIRWKLQSANAAFYFLKERAPYLKKEEFELHLHAHRHIQENNGPVVPLCLSADQQAVLTWESRQFELQAWVTGRHPALSLPDDLFTMGKLIARFQNTVSSFVSEPEQTWLFPKNRSKFSPAQWFEILSYIQHIEYALEQKHIHGHPTINWLKERIKRFGMQIVPNTLPKQFVHGDADRFNCIITTSGMAFLVDLDSLHWDYRIADIAQVCSIIGGIDFPAEESEPNVKLDLQRRDIELVLRGFETHSPLNQMEKECFQAFLSLYLIRSFVSCFNLDDPSAYRDRGDLLNQIERLISLLGKIEVISLPS